MIDARKGSPRGLAAWFMRRAHLSADRPALTFEGITWRYGVLADRIARLAAVLRAGGVGPGDRVGFLGFNHPDFITTLVATAHVGGIFVPLNFRLTGAELGYIINDAGIHTLLVCREHLELIEGVQDLPSVRQFIAVDGGLDALMTAALPDDDQAAVDEHDVAAIFYTSGTTGRPKGAMLTHQNIWANNLNWNLAFDVTGNDTMLTMAPLFHVGGLFVLTTSTFLMGGHVVVLKSFDAGRVLADVEKYKVTISFGVPAMMLFVSQHERFQAADLSSLRLFVAGGAPVPEPLLVSYAARGIPVSQCYGMSEVVSAATFLETDRARAKLNSAGRPVMLADVMLIDVEGVRIETAGERGEICIRGDNVTPGYWNLPEATALSFAAEGWFRSGDIGYFDDEGFLYVCDRVKDMVISGGENVYPAEVESVLFEHPAIANVAVIGAPDEKWGERVVAVAVLKPAASLTLDELQSFCDGRLARYKLPRELRLMAALPLNASGKVLKRDLR
ncbi:long-chain-fatty-acid--CoA ligase [Oleomonas cavernae]|uniref:3-methylmercaptopropionyl-CoA ligase n=1 Tax=Oleomonas cavernae TaxID=2320859 RepID=A0A418WJA6_9PROT|nr:long-chain fatty acid--CoA ligase [Oleomonas cavernae]RJF90136.1 long-chain-fatty-acid--CoA ligase [Oleomonas cavernae]